MESPNTAPSLLKELGFNRREAEAYLALLRLQHGNAHQVAQEAKLERTTTYDLLDDLVERGLATKSVEGKRQSYLAEPVERLVELTEKQRGAASRLLPILRSLPGTNRRQPILRYYDTIDGIRRVVMETLNSKEKLRRDFAAVDSIVELLGQRFIDRQVEERVRRKVYARSLRSPDSIRGWSKKDWYLRGDNPKLLREVRILPGSFSFVPVIFIHDDVVTIVSSSAETFALVLQSKELSRAMKVLFDATWETAKHVKKNLPLKVKSNRLYLRIPNLY